MNKFTKQFCDPRVASLFSLWLLVSQAALAQGGNFPLSYVGRLTQADGAPLTGPVDVTVNFWTAYAGGNTLTAPIEIANVNLNQGVFTIPLELTPAQVSAVFGQGTDPVFIEISAAGKTYNRQQYSYVPFALRVPVDKKTLAFDGEGKLGLSLTSTPGPNEFLTKDSVGRLAWGSPLVTTIQGQNIASTAPTSGQVLTYSGGQWVPQTPAVGQDSGLPSGGVSAQYLAGNKTWQTLNTSVVPEGTNKYFTPALAISALSASAPITYSTTTGFIGIDRASGTSNGYLSSSDWTIFNSKQDALGFAPLNKAGDTMAGALDMNSKTLTGLAAPSSSSDAATKAYVDSAAAPMLKKDGSVALTGPWVVGNDLANVGSISMAAGKTLLLSNNSTDPTGFTDADKGKTWFDSQTNKIKYWDGSTAQALGIAGAGLTSLNGLTGSTQTFANGTSGTSPEFSSDGTVHTLNIPMAANATVTAGLLSNSDYAAFAGKVGSVVGDDSVSVTNSGGIATVSLSSVGTAGTYLKVRTNAKGQVTSGGALIPGDIPSLDASKITSGQISVANGGTGIASGSSGGIPYFSGSSTIASSPTLTANGIVIGGGVGGAPTTAAALTDGQVLIGSSGSAPVSATLGTGANGGVVVSTGPGSVTLDTAQDIRISASPNFVGLSLNGLGANSLLKTNGTKAVSAASSLDITSTLGFTPINKAGDTMSGVLNLGANDVISAGNIQMAASKTLALSANTADPTGLQSTDKGSTWFNSTTGQIKYWDGANAVALGIAGSGISGFNDQLGSMQTLATPGTSGLAPSWSSAANAHTLNIPMASTTSVTAGLLSNSDYNTFNGKVTSVVSGTGVSVGTTGNIATVNLANVGTAGTYPKVTTDAYGRVTAGTTLSVGDIPLLPASLITSGTLNTAQLPTAGTAGTYAKVTTDAYGRVTAGTTLASSDITSSLGYTPINKAGDTMSGVLILPPDGLTAGTNQLVLVSGKVGIGITSPGATLDVNGTIKISGGTPGAGKVLTSDANGLASWSTAAVGSITGITAGTGFTGGGTSGSVTLNADVGTTANKLVQLDASAKLPAVDGSALTNLNPASLSSAVSVAKGGTGLTSGTSGGIPYFDAASTMATSAALTANGVVLGGGAGVAPTSTTAGTTNTVLRVPSGGGAPGFGALDVSQSSAVTGALNVGNGGTGTSLLATGGSGQYLKQTASGAAVSVGTIVAADLPTMVGDSGSGGTKGAVPAPISGDSAAGKFLKADGSWSVPSATANWAVPGTIGSTTPNSGKFTTLTTSGNVGIGTTSPTTAIHVNAPNAALTLQPTSGVTQQTAVQFRTNSNNNGFSVGRDVNNNGANDFFIYDQTASTARLYVSSTGNVGIGTTNPAGPLDVYPATSTTNGAPIYIRGQAGFTGGSYLGGNILLLPGAGGPGGPTGYVGIGTSNPAGPLDVYPATSTTNGAPIYIRGQAGSLAGSYVGGNILLLPGAGGPGGPMGSVGIGTTSPGVTLDVNGSLRAGSSASVTTCGSGQANGEGSQRYNYTTHYMEYCNGTTWVALNGIGIGQSWTNLIASRALGTTYTNSSGSPIIVSVTVYGNVGANGYVGGSAIVGGVTVANIGGQISAAYNNSAPLSFVVPNGATYSVTSSSSLSVWAELR